VKWLWVLTLVLLTPAAAQQPQPQSKLTITLTPDEVQFVLNKLSEHPWKDVNPVMSKIINQINPQMTATTPPKEANKEAKPNE
jgi:hypothetical protein